MKYCIIFSFLNFQDLENISKLNKRWYRLVRSMIKAYQIQSPKYLNLLKNMTQIQSLYINLNREYEEKPWSQILTNLTSLSKLCITYHHINTESQDYKNIEKLTQLVTLSLIYYERSIYFENNFLTSLTNLQRLCIGNSFYFKDNTIDLITKLTHLSHLSIFGNSITNKGISLLTLLTNLTILDISCNPSITVEGIIHYTRLKNLKFLDVSGVQVSIKDIIIERLKSRMNVCIGHLTGNPFGLKTNEKLVYY